MPKNRLVNGHYIPSHRRQFAYKWDLLILLAIGVLACGILIVILRLH